jgi:hypothetical protein
MTVLRGIAVGIKSYRTVVITVLKIARTLMYPTYK